MNLFKISLAVSIFGIFLLLLLSNIIEPELVPISKISDSMLNKKVKIQGEIFKIQDKQSFKILSIEDNTGKIDVLCNCKNESQIKNNQKIIVAGKVQAYRDYLQISADKIISSLSLSLFLCL